jgi:two-component system CheB/CheR fusion protein
MSLAVSVSARRHGDSLKFRDIATFVLKRPLYRGSRPPVILRVGHLTTESDMAAKKKPNRPRSVLPEINLDESPAPQRTASAPPAPEDAVQGKDDRVRLGFSVVGIGASAGGLEAFKRFFKTMPPDSGMAFILIPHLDPKHDSLMVELVARQTAMNVVEASEGQLIEINHVYIIPPNKFLAIGAGRLHLSAPPEPRGRRTALDTFFGSLAEEERERSIGIVLSGTGSHGTPGIKEIKLAGGMAMVQKPDSADYGQMPESAIATGLVDYVLAPEQMPEALLKYVRQPYVNSVTGDDASPDLLNRILVVVKARTRYDFRSYRKNMLHRRIQRRMGLWQVEKMSGYLDLLHDNRDEIIALYKDLLIGVTSFFRDPEAFQVLEQRVIPELVSRKVGDAPLRIWVPGCSSGEEAYSIAMVVIEKGVMANLAPNFQIFASDIDEDALAVARRGIYPASAVEDISPERLRRFFTKADEHSYQVVKRLRDAVVFAPQNLIGDAPFSKLDLISCRNLLIYLEPEIQKKVVSLFHFALNDGGCLMLGPSETVGRQTNLFEPISSPWRVYQRSGPTRRHIVEIPIDTGASRRNAAAEIERRTITPMGLTELMQKQLLAEYAPASVLINAKFEVLCFQGPAVDYLEFPSGEPTRDLLALARQGLRTRLRALVSKVLETGELVTDVVPRVKRDSRYFPCQVTIRPLGDVKSQSELLLVTFSDRAEPEPSPPTRGDAMQDLSLIGQLESELKSTREDLQGTIEELESSNEEMKASNEEMMSMNEELQSVNEELETSKEELQSTNEELITVNTQLSQKVIELNGANNDISNLLNSTNIPTVFLTTDLRIRRFTPSAVKLIHLLASDVGRPIVDVTRKFTADLLLDDCRSMLQTQSAVEREVRSDNGQYFSRRVLPYLTADQHLEGVVITFIDLTDRKRAADLVNEARLQAENVLATVREPLLVLDDSLRVRSANASFYRAFELGPADVVDQPLFSLQAGTWNTSPLQHSFDDMLTHKSELNDFELSLPSQKRGERMMLLNARIIPSLDERPALILLAIEDITDRKHAEQELKTLNLTLEDRVSRRTAEAESRAALLARSEQALRESEARLRAIVTTAADAIITIDAQGLIESCNPATDRMFGYPANAMVGKNIEMLILWAEIDGNMDALVRSLRTDERANRTLEREVIGRRQDGSTFPIDLALSEFHDGSRQLFTGIIRDVSERKSLQQELLSIADAEQRRIGQDLHDDIGQELTGLAMKAETLCEIVTEQQVPKRELAADIVAGLDRTRRKLRALSRGMIPVEIDSNGLVTALDELTVRLGDDHRVACVFECRGPSVEIDPRQASQLYHIAQEAITNALKHAQARNIRVSLEVLESTIKLEVRDDGVGIADGVAQPDGMGLRIMSYRAGLIHGKLNVRRDDKDGTLVSCVVMRGAERGTSNPQVPKRDH